MFPDLTLSPSPNWNERPVDEKTGTVIIDTVILHYTGMQTAGEALARMCDPDAAVSAHYMIEESGKVHELVPPSKRAWHAGVSIWQGRHNLNHTSIGIELVNPGHEFGYRAFPVRQIESLTGLLRSLQHTYSIPQHRFIGHSDIAPDRKMDPGELFPWERLEKVGFGVWPGIDTSDYNTIAENDAGSPEIASFMKDLGSIGYNVENHMVQAHIPEDIITAFQRHWRPARVSGTIDRGTRAAARAVAALMRGHQQD